MNETEYNHTFLKYEKRATYVWIIFGALFLFAGLFCDLTWLNNLGTKHLAYNLPLYLQYVSLLKPLSIIVGCFMIFAFILKPQVLKFYHADKFKPEILLAVFSLIIFVILSFVAYYPFKNYPYSLDEYNFFYQAKIFSEGKLFLEVPQSYKPFVEQYMIFENSKLFSKYPPGFSLLLSIGVLFNCPGLINPFIAVATLFALFYLVKSFMGPKYALLSVILMSTTPYFIAYSASYYTHPTALLLTTLLFLLVRKYEITRKDLHLFFIGLIAGYSFLTRPLDSFCAVVPVFVYLSTILFKEKKFIKISYPIFTFTIVFSLFLVYNYILTEKITIAVYPIVDKEFKVIDPHTTGFLANLISITKSYLTNGINSVPKLLVRYLIIPCAIFLPLFAIFGAFQYRSKWKWLLLSNYVMLILLYNFHPGLGWPSYGARYYYSGFVSLVVLATAGFRQLIEMLRNKRLVYHIFAFILCTHLIFSVTAIWAYSYRFKIFKKINDDLVNTCPVGSIVILNNPSDIKPSNSNHLRIANFIDLVDVQRNPFMDPSRLIAIKDKNLRIIPINLSEIKSNFPYHSICYYDFDILRND